MRFWIFLFMVAALSTRAVDLKQGLVLHYTFDDATGGIARDASGGGDDGKIVNATFDKSGVRSGCLHFSGNGSFVRAVRNPTTNGSYTVSLWFRPDPEAIGKLQNSQLIAMNRRYQMGFATNGPHYRFYSYCLNASAYGYGALRADSGVFDLVPNRWYHGVLLIEDGGAGFFLNGRRLGFISGPGANRGDLELLVGALNNDSSAGPRYFFPGCIDEVRIYNRSLTDEEITALFRQDAPPDLLPSAPVSLGPSYVVKNGRFFLRTEKDGKVEERELTDQETAALLGKAAAEPAKQSAEICEIGFSNDPKGDQDVTYFLPGETLNIRVHDVDLPSANTNLSVQIFLTQTNAQETAAAPRLLKQLDRAHDGSFRAAVPLTNFVPGSVFASVVATDATGQPVLMRSSRLEILANAAPAQTQP